MLLLCDRLSRWICSEEEVAACSLRQSTKALVYTLAACHCISALQSPAGQPGQHRQHGGGQPEDPEPGAEADRPARPVRQRGLPQEAPAEGHLATSTCCPLPRAASSPTSPCRSHSASLSLRWGSHVLLSMHSSRCFAWLSALTAVCLNVVEAASLPRVMAFSPRL